MQSPSTLASIIENARATQHQGIWYVGEASPRNEEPPYPFVSYAALVRRAESCGAAFQRLNIERGERFAFVVPDLAQAVPLFLGALHAGVVPVPLLAPTTASEANTYGERVRRLLAACGATKLIATAKVRSLLDPELAARVIETQAFRGDASLDRPAVVHPDDVAIVQLDSETGPTPVAHVRTHREILASLADAAEKQGIRDDDVFVSWLPPFHDAGLLALLLPLWRCRSLALFPTLHYLKRPARWLEVISKVGGTVSYAPEHGYSFCSKRALDQELLGLNLSSWRLAGSVGSAPSEETVGVFTRRFASVGFQPAALRAARTPLLLPEGTREEPLSSGQRALWFLAELAPASVAYNVALCYRIVRPFSVEALRDSLSAIVARHPALRTVFPDRNGRPYRHVSSKHELAFEEVDASALHPDELRVHVEREIGRPFDLRRGPLFVARLFRVSPSEGVLLLVAHHINVDALSFLIIGSELSALYTHVARSPGLGMLPMPEHSYDDFVRYQRELLAGSEGERLRRYWGAELEGAPSYLELPTDRPRPARQTFRGAAVELRFPDALADSLRSLARAHDTTLFTVLLAAFQLLLARLSGQRDIVVASPVSGRSSAAFQDVVGYFVNTLPVRGRLDLESSFGEFVRTLREAVAGALDHQDLPFPQILEQAAVAREPSRSPLCQVMFQLQTHRARDGIADVMRNAPFGGSAELGELTIEPVHIERRIAQFDLSLDLTDFGSGLTGFCEYNRDLFDRGTIEQWVSVYERLCELLVHAPDAALAQTTRAIAAHLPRVTTAGLPLSAEQRELVLHRFNQTEVHYPEGRVHDAIAARAAMHPERAAVQYLGASLTYAELNRRANRLAHELIARGAGADVLVGVAMDRSLSLVVSLLAVLKAGAAYVPLDPTLPRERLAFMLADSQPAVILVDPPYQSLVEGTSAAILTTEQIDTITSDPARSGADPDRQVRRDDLAYVIYTSGSTGTPKGVCNTHAGLWNRLCWMQDYLALGAEDCVLQKTPYSFDVSVWEFFWPLMVGARLAVARPEGHRDSRYLLEEIATSGVTTLHFVPSMLGAFLYEPDLAAARGLRRVVCSGEALSYELMARFFARLPETSLHNLYGPTEASIDVTAWTCVDELADTNRGASVPIGRPIANTSIYILDERCEPVALGTVGEIYIGGVGLARGYHQRPELTAERFIAHPLSSEAGARLYRTGDLGRFRADGCIEYLGRNDDQVKVNGYRIELGEVEAALRSHESVRDCVVAARRLPSGGHRLEAFVVTREALAFTREELSAWLSARLPEFMVPQSIHEVSTVPLTHSGKIDRKALLALGDEAPAVAPAHAEVADEREAVLVDILQTVLGRSVSVADNYFSIGGDSIRSLQVRAMAQARGFDLDLQELYDKQTVRELAPALKPRADLAAPKGTAAFELLRPSERATLATFEDAYPATQLQLGMLYHSEFDKESWAYYDVLSFELELASAWDATAMEDALRALMSAHPVLRSSFDVASFTRPLQRVAREVAPPFSVRDLTREPREAARRALDHYIACDKAAGYQLREAPLFRVMVHVFDERHIELTLSFHHAILDGWSAATLLRELFTEYLRRTEAGAFAAAPALEAPRYGFQELVRLELASLASPESRAFWLNRLEGCESGRLPRWPEAYRSEQSGASRMSLPLDPALCSRLVEVASELRVPLKALLLAAHVRALSAFTDSEQVVTGRVLHGRPELPGSERILGLFLNTVPLRVDLRDLTWAALIRQIARDEEQVHPHRHFPLREIQRLLGHTSLFETAFNFVNFHLYEQLIASERVRVLGHQTHENTTFGLMVNCVLSPLSQQLSLEIEYDGQQIAEEQAQQIARAHVRALEALSRDLESDAQESPLSDQLAVLPAEATNTTALPPKLVQQSFDATVANTPNAIAAQLGEATLTYRELASVADDIARELRASGIEAGEVVAICAEPSLERAAALLAVLRVGCAYLPLDPSFPEERLTFMVRTAKVKRALATRAHAGEASLRALHVTVVDVTQRSLARSLSDASDVDAHDPAYVIFTSGSSGEPKGIVMPHGPLANLVAWQCSNSELDPRAATAQFSPFSFDVSFQEFFSTWAAGGRLVLIPEAARRDARELAKIIEAQRIARLFLPVVMLQQLCEVAEELSLELLSLREIHTAGEQLEINRAVRAFFARHRACRLTNQYGPSETHVATAHALPADPAVWPALPPIGAPLPGVRAYVLDARGRPAPIGVPGELHLGGACVATGYAHRPELTNERFLRDPFVDDASARMYRTGDRARLLPDGTLEYLGRSDTQIKIRGFRVEPAEVEAAILATSGESVQRAAVVAVPSRSHKTRYELAAYVLMREGAPFSASAIEAALARRLPQAMIPSAIRKVDTLPLTPSGKVDRRALLAIGDTHALEVDHVRVPPETPLELELTGLFRDVLGAAELGVTDDFFARGGDSLAAVRLMARVQRRYRVELPIAALLAAPTVRTLARALEAETPSGGSSLVALTPRLRDAAKPPVFCVHPVGGNVLCYLPLARHLGPEQPFYGLAARGLDGATPPHTSVVEMAASYAADIVAVQPKGPIHLAGWSFGGIVAVEIARQLASAGRTVAPVVVMDTIASVRFQVQPSEDELFECVAMELFGAEVDDGSFEEILAHGSSLSRETRFERLMQSARERGVRSEGAELAQLEQVFSVIHSNIRAAYDYVPEPYSGPVVLLRCLDPMPARLRRLHDRVGSAHADEQNGWAPYCPDLEVLHVRGDHLTVVFEPHVARVAEVIRRVVERTASEATFGITDAVAE